LYCLTTSTLLVGYQEKRQADKQSHSSKTAPKVYCGYLISAVLTNKQY